MNATATLHSLPLRDPGSSQAHSGMTAGTRRGAPRPPVHFSVVVAPPVPVSVPESVERQPLYPQVPPEAPMAMQAKPFEFLGLRDIAVGLLPVLRPNGEPAPAGMAARIPSQR